MGNVLQEFTYEKSKEDFEKLSKMVGKTVRVNYVRNGDPIKLMTLLLGAVPFNGIYYSGGFIPFVSQDRIIREICDTNGNIIYDRKDEVSPQIRIEGKDLNRYKTLIMGTTNGQAPTNQQTTDDSLIQCL